jgi:hypothetical protein
VELVDEVRRIGEIAGRLPRVVGQGVVFPANFVKEIATAESRIEDFFNFPFEFVVDNDRRQRILCSIGDS